MNAFRAEAQVPGTESPAIDGRYEPIAVVARNGIAIRMTAIDHGATTGAARVWLTLPAPSLAPRRRDALRERFRRLAHLVHPNIPAYRCHSSAGGAYCVSDCVDGEPLSDIVALLAPGALEKAEIDRIVRAVGSALAAAHEVGISHGALRQDCVIVTPDLDIRLTGFDLGDGRPAFEPAADIAALARMAAELHADPQPRERLPADPRSSRKRRRRSSPLRLALLAALLLSILAVDPEYVARLVRALPTLPAAVTPAEPATEAALLPAPAAGTGAPIDPTDADRVDDDGALAEPATGAPDAAAAVTTSGPSSARMARAPARDDSAAALTNPGRELRFVPQVSRLAVGESDAMVRLSLRTTPGRSADIIWWLADGSARRELDYVDLGLQSATIPAGSAIDIVVPLVADAIHEGDEDFEIYASHVDDGKQIGVPVSATIRILDDD